MSQDNPLVPDPLKQTPACELDRDNLVNRSVEGMNDPYTEQARALASLSAENGLLRAEIERLRAERDDYKGVADDLAAFCKALQVAAVRLKDAEIERLRGLLEKAALAVENLFVEVQGHCPSELYEDGYSDAIAAAASVLRAMKLFHGETASKCIATHYGGPWCKGRCQNPRDCTASPLT